MSSASQEPRTGRRTGRLRGAAASVGSPGAWMHAVRLLHYFNDTHVVQRRRLTLGEGVRISPNVSFSYGERISIGDWSRVGARSTLWAGPRKATIAIGSSTTIAPDVLVTCANYGMASERRILDQPQTEADVVIGSDVWLGARVIVLPGVTIGDGCVVGAGAVVTKSLPAGSIAVGTPARVVGSRTPGAPLAEAPEG